MIAATPPDAYVASPCAPEDRPCGATSIAEVEEVEDARSMREDIQLTWVVFPASVPMKRDPQMLMSPVKLEVSYRGGSTQTTDLPPQFGGLSALNQAACGSPAYPLEHNEVAKLTFYEGGAGGFVVRRHTRDSLTVYEWSQSDGACMDAKGNFSDCPVHQTRAATANVPAAAPRWAKFREQIVEVDAQGARRPFDCGPLLQDY